MARASPGAAVTWISWLLPVRLFRVGIRDSGAPVDVMATPHHAVDKSPVFVPAKIHECNPRSTKRTPEAKPNSNSCRKRNTDIVVLDQRHPADGLSISRAESNPGPVPRAGAFRRRYSNIAAQNRS
ncbi:hypothetical protein F5B21DRAFT_166536 [Xylaria acuta]|nr:hypothetical protein F5B21DRAFT_166536 [Xylaria acuta]